MRIFGAICLLGLLHWSSDVALPQTSRQQPNAVSAHTDSKSYEYKNSKYGFTFLLPVTWKGCKIVEDRWRGYAEAERGEEIVERGPEITIVNPRSKDSDQYQNIYIMIFTHKQWKSVQEDKFIVSAAPIGPGELDRNAKYVFAVPPRG